jgi:PAS domain S-box-containing protein
MNANDSTSKGVWLFARSWGLAALVISIPGLLHLEHQRTLFRQSVLDQLSTIADTKVQQILAWREERLQDARSLMADPYLAQGVQQYLANPSNREFQARIVTKLRTGCTEGHGLRALLLDPQLEVRAAFPESKTYFGPIAGVFARQAMLSNQVVVSDLHRSRFSGEIHFDIAIPVRLSAPPPGATHLILDSTNAQTIAVIDLEVDPCKFLYPLIQNWPTPSLTAETLLVRREGDDVVFLNELRHRKQTALAFRLPLRHTNNPAAMALRGREGNLEGVDYRGERVLAAVRAVPGTPWKLVAKIDQQEAFAALRRQMWVTLAAILSLVLGAGLASWALWRHAEARRLGNELAERKQREEQLRKLSRAVEQSPASIVITDRRGRIEYVNPKFCQVTGYTAEEARGQNPRLLKSGEMTPEGYRELWETILGGREWHGEFHNKKKDGELYREFASISPIVDDAGQITHFVAVKEDITQRKRVEAELARERDLLATLLENTPDAIYFKDLQSRFVRCSHSFKNLFKVTNLSGVLGKTDFDFFTEGHARPAYEDEQEIIRTGKPLIGKREQETHSDGRVTWALTCKMPWRDKDGHIIGTFGISKDVTAMQEAETRLEAMHRQLVEASRHAGMAEVATDILHNVGNVLNSVNVASSCATDLLRHSKVSTLAKLAELLRQHEADWSAFATTDPRGRQLPKFLTQLTECLLAERAAALQEFGHLQKNIDHIKDIVVTQQAYAKVSGVTQTVPPSELVRDALHMNASSLARHDVQVTQDFAPTPPVTVDKHKVLGILVNLIHNAKYACDESRRSDKHLTVRVANGEGRIKISVTDNGVGILPENLVRIFSHGFTTRKNGHGFGLHSAALAARELGGSLTVHSAGPGKGAAFTLELPADTSTSNPA